MLDVLIRGGTIVDGLGGEPFAGDLGIKGGKIVEIGAEISSEAHKVIEADGAIITPGFVDIHTHFDGQVSWDDDMDPSFSHGVTSVVMGNCGVGFAPVPKGGEKDLIEVMEGVEDIPGTALYEGIPWGEWETFPEYLDHIASRKYSLDIGTQVPHGAIRNYVMGKRGRDNQAATTADIEEMSALVEEALRAGALGFSTSRTIGHRDIRGNEIPGTHAQRDEILSFADAIKRVGRGVFELIPAGCVGELEHMGGEQSTYAEEIDLMTEVSKRGECPVTFTLVQNGDQPSTWRDVLESVAKINKRGGRLSPQVACRPIGIISSLLTYHMFQRRETYLEFADLPFEERLAKMRDPAVRAAILADKDIPHEYSGSMVAAVHEILRASFDSLYEMSEPVEYEPTRDQNFTNRALRDGKSNAEFMYDFLTGLDGKRFAILLGSNFHDANHDAIRAMMTDPNTVVGLSDAGAHVNMIFDGVAPTYQLTHWAKGRVRGDKIPLGYLVYKQSYKNAQLYGLTDRGSLEIGKRADINVIDFEKLKLGGLEVHHDLPAGGSRILQSASGYLATFVNGVQTRENDKDTGARPGRLIRGALTK
ncbi:MAG: amidohydrolase family protein [Hyphomonadaceae bacterium]